MSRDQPGSYPCRQADFPAVPESPLEKVLRLAGGTTKSYVRTNPLGRRVAVHQYPTPHPAHGHVAGFGSLKVGQVVVIKGVSYDVVRVNVPPPLKQPGPNTKGVTTGKNTGSQGKGVNTSKTAKSGASAGQGVNTGPNVNQVPQTAALAGVTVPKGAKTMTALLRCQKTQKMYFTTLPVNLLLTVA